MRRDIPRGEIFGWSGSITSIPSTFRLCDGTRGTPDLRDRFIPGAGTAYSPADTGGAVNHTHGFTGNSHTHDIQLGTEILGGPNFDDDSFAGISTGTTNPKSSLPPYHALVYIMYDGRPI